MPHRVTPTELGHIFVGVTRAGEASRRPYGEKIDCRRAYQQNDLNFQIDETATAAARTNPRTLRAVSGCQPREDVGEHN
jgi:hypothetical protein